LPVHGPGAKADSCGGSFAVLSAEVSTVGLRLRLVVPRPMPAAVASIDPYGDLPFTSWGRWQSLRSGAGGLNSCYTACGCGKEYRCGVPLGGGMWRHA
jgi:hypothetical protein